MRIIMPTFEEIKWMPPTIYLIQTLAEHGHEVYYITVYPDRYWRDGAFCGRIHNIPLASKDYSLQHRIKYIKGVSGMLMRIDTVVKQVISRKLRRVISSLVDDNSILWIVNEMTVMLAGASFLKGYKYLFTIYELHEKNRLIRIAARNAYKVIVPEYCRAHIMRVKMGLKEVPMVLPNKTEIRMTDNLSQKAIDAIVKLEEFKQRNVLTIIYIGRIDRERPLEGIINAIKDERDYRLFVMGGETTYLSELQHKYPGCFEYIGSFSPPEHVEVAAHAAVGLLIYVGVSEAERLNSLFCAPNKIFEYTGKGLPVIANDIPGLRFQIVPNAIGKLCDFDNAESVISSLRDIKDHYRVFSENARNYYDSMDTETQIIEMVSDVASII